MEDRLKYILGLCVEWVKYAEKKNGALLVATSGLVLSLIGRFPDKTSGGARIYFWIGCASLTLSAVVCLLSFIPQIRFPWIGFQENKCPEDNLFFFGHIANYSAPEFLDALYRADGTTLVSSKLQLDLAGQIIVNAGISLKKFRLFTIAIWLAALGVASLICTTVQMLAQ